MYIKCMNGACSCVLLHAYPLLALPFTLPQLHPCPWRHPLPPFREQWPLCTSCVRTAGIVWSPVSPISLSTFSFQSSSSSSDTSMDLSGDSRGEGTVVWWLTLLITPPLKSPPPPPTPPPPRHTHLNTFTNAIWHHAWAPQSFLCHTSSTVAFTYFRNDLSLVMSVLYQLKKIYGSKRPGYRLLMNSSGCAIA